MSKSENNDQITLGLQTASSGSQPRVGDHVPLEAHELGEAIARRTRSLLAPAPILDLERTKSTRGVDFSQHDLRMLCLLMLDVVIDKMGFGTGATRRDLIHALMPVLRSTEPEIAPDRAEQILDALLGALLNERERRQQFVERYASLESGQVCWREFAYRLLEEMQLSDGDERVFRASHEAINLYTQMLGFNLEDAAIADAAVLRYQAERGRLDDAIHTAHQAQIRAKAYAEKVRLALEIARRDADEAQWVKTVLPLIDDALNHIGDRLTKERELREGLEQRRDRATGGDLAKLTRLLNEIEKSERTNLDLHNLLLSASEKFREEHSRQRLRRRAALLPNLEPEVFLPWLTLETATARSMVIPGLNILAGHAVPVPPGLEQLWTKLLAPPVTPSPHSADVTMPVTGSLTNPPPPFASDDYGVVREFLRKELAGERRLSEMLATANERGLSPSARRLFVLLTMQQYGADEQRLQFRVQPEPDSFQTPEFAGDELLLSRVQQ